MAERLNEEPDASAAPVDESDPTVWLKNGGARRPRPPTQVPETSAPERPLAPVAGPAAGDADAVDLRPSGDFEARLGRAEKRLMESLEVETAALRGILDEQWQRIDTLLSELRRDQVALRETLDSVHGRAEALERAQGVSSDELTAAVARVALLEEALTEVDTRARMVDELAKALSRYPDPPGSRPGPDDGVVSINDASFEDLRGVGLTITQSARLIAMRDSRGGFRSEEELSEVPGIPDATRAELVRRIRF